MKLGREWVLVSWPKKSASGLVLVESKPSSFDERFRVEATHPDEEYWAVGDEVHLNVQGLTLVRESAYRNLYISSRAGIWGVLDD